MNNSEKNRHIEGSETTCLSVDHLIDYAFNADEQSKAHIDQCSTCQMILEGIRFEINSKKEAGEMVSSDLLKIQEQLKEDQLVDLIENNDYYSDIANNSGLSITTENFIREDIDELESDKQNSFSNVKSLKLFYLNSYSGKIAAAIALIIIAVSAIYFANDQSSESLPVAASDFELYELKVPVTEDQKMLRKTEIESIGHGEDPSIWVEILAKKADKERRGKVQTNPFLLRITNKKDNRVLFQQAVSHPPKKLYNKELKGEWGDSTKYKIDYFLISNMELIDSLKKKD